VRLLSAQAPNPTFPHRRPSQQWYIPCLAGQGTNTQEQKLVKFNKSKYLLRLQDCLLPATITCIILCSASYALDILFDSMGVPVSKTILNDLVIGILGALAVSYYVRASRESHNFETAKARIELIGELNRRIRQSLADISVSAMSEDRLTRLESLDQAINGIDDVLCGFQAETNRPR
jgi:hypothetical protein